jgi:phage/plasmid primase-like uncharacterized protein
MMPHDSSAEFADAIRAAGLTPPDSIEPERFLRFPGCGKRNGNTAGWCKLFADQRGGIFGDFSTGLVENWQAERPQPLTPAERERFREQVERARTEAEAARREEQARAAEKAVAIWDAAKPAPGDHPYLRTKGVAAHSGRVYHGDLVIGGMVCDGALVVSMRDSAGELHSLQFIASEGEKRYLPGGRVRGCYHAIGKPEGGMLYIAEGYATAASVHEATGYAVAVAFDAGNLESVARTLREKYPDRRIVICADDDYRTDGNPGLTKAMEAACAVAGLIAVPDFGVDRPDGATDFNDLAQHRGAEAVARSVGNALEPEVSTHRAGTLASDSEAESSGAVLLDAVHDFLCTFVAYPSPDAAMAHTLWIAHAHLMDAWESTPRLAFLSPEPGSGKTRALEITETLVPRPVEAINATPAYLFRKVSAPEGLPTILYDEIDTLFGPKAKDNEEIRGILNAGHRRGAMAGRCVVRGKIIDTEELPAFCAVALAGLGNLPDTILTRSVVVRMRRRSPSETVEPYRRRVHAPIGNGRRDRLAHWARAVQKQAAALRPLMPDGVTDRNADVWEPLLAVADLAGGDWPRKARCSAVSLVSLAKAASPSLGVRLLGDLREIFGVSSDSVFTEEILRKLRDLDEAPWGDLKGKPIDPRRLAALLKPYGIASKQIRIGATTAKGYARTDLHDAWTRYLGQAAMKSETSGTPDTTAGKQECEPISGEVF